MMTDGNSGEKREIGGEKAERDFWERKLESKWMDGKNT